MGGWGVHMSTVLTESRKGCHPLHCRCEQLWGTQCRFSVRRVNCRNSWAFSLASSSSNFWLSSISLLSKKDAPTCFIGTREAIEGGPVCPLTSCPQDLTLFVVVRKEVQSQLSHLDPIILLPSLSPSLYVLAMPLSLGFGSSSNLPIENGIKHLPYYLQPLRWLPSLLRESLVFHSLSTFISLPSIWHCLSTTLLRAWMDVVWADGLGWIMGLSLLKH